jgi:hypothetical protein
MSRDHTKNVANYADLPAGDAAQLDGASIIAFSIWAYLDTITNNSTSNYLFVCPNPGSLSGISAQINGSGGNNTLQLRGRTDTSDTTRTVNHSIATATGAWVQYGGVWDFPNDLMYTVMNGAVESKSTTGWTTTVFDAGIGANGSFRIGQSGDPVAGLVANRATDGRIAHFAMWTGFVPVQAEWTALASGVLPWRIRPGNLKLYRPWLGLDTNEPDLITHNSVTITGTLPIGASEPPVQLMSDSFGHSSWMEPSLTTIAPQAWGNIMRQMAS